MSSEKPKKRLPRGRRVSAHQRPPMVLTDRDREIVKAVNDYHVLLGQQIEALFSMSRSTVQYRLSRLYHHEFLDRHFLPVITNAPAASAILYTLGKRGQDVLTHTFNYDQDALNRFPKKPSWQFIDHLLEINDVRISIARACAMNHFTLETWQDETVFRARPDYVTIRDSQGKKSEKPVYPDAYFCLRVPQGKAHFFLELDRGTEPRSKFRPQIEVYGAYTRSGLYEARFATKSLRILIVTTSEERLQNLKVVTENAGGDRKYWFSTLQQISAESVLTQPIWERIGSKERFVLIG